MPLHMRLPKLKGFKNPNKVETVAHISPLELVATIKQNNAKIDELMTEIEAILQGVAINE